MEDRQKTSNYNLNKLETTDKILESIPALAENAQIVDTQLKSLNDNKVAKTTTIAGVNLQDNVTKAEMLNALNVADGSQANVIESVKVNGTAITPSNKSVNISVPTNNNQLTNGAGYQTASQVSSAITTGTANKADKSTTLAGYGITNAYTKTETDSAISTAIGGIIGVEFKVVQQLPSTGEAGTIYLISNSGSSPNVYDEYIYVNNNWEKIGTTEIDISGKEDKTNKVTSISSSSTNTQYPSAKCVYDYVDTMITQAIGGSY